MKKKFKGWTPLGLMLCTLVLMLPVRALAFEPKLLWTKTFPNEQGPMEVKLARQSGDVLILSKETKQIILIDTTGKDVIHLGPMKDSLPLDMDISQDGRIFIYFATTEDAIPKNHTQVEKSNLKEHPTAKAPKPFPPAGGYSFLHYVTRKGEELWSRKCALMRVGNGNCDGAQVRLSPDAKYAAIAPKHDMEGFTGSYVVMFDSYGETLWSNAIEFAENLNFSQNGSDYFAFSKGLWYISTQSETDKKARIEGGNPGIESLDTKTGKLLWQTYYGSDDQIPAFSEAGYVFTEHRVYDLQGRIVLDVPNVKYVNKIIVRVQYPDKIVEFKWPEMTVLREFSFAPIKNERGLKLSDDGHFIVIAGAKPIPLQTNYSNPTEDTFGLYVFDTVNKEQWQIKFENWLDNFELTQNGRYLLIYTQEPHKIALYQLH